MCTCDVLLLASIAFYGVDQFCGQIWGVIESVLNESTRLVRIHWEVRFEYDVRPTRLVTFFEPDELERVSLQGDKYNQAW